MKTLLTAFTLALALAVTGVRIDAQSGYDLFQKALATERADGDLRAAIQLYDRVVKDFGTDRALAARALVGMGQCYEKLGDLNARAVYERVVRDYADQKSEATAARSRLAALPAPAAAPVSQTAHLVWKGQEAFGSVRGTISPDGRYLTFLDLATGGLALHDFTENSSRVLAQEPGNSMFYAVFSPDGRRIAYAWVTPTEENLQYDLRVISAIGPNAQPKVVYRNEEMNQLRPFGWTPDGKQVLALRSLRDGTNQITLIGLEDGKARVLKSLNWNYTAMSLSPDGRFVAYDGLSGAKTSAEEIYVLATDGSRETKVVQGPRTNRSPIWSPDGSRLLFLSNRTGSLSLWGISMRDGQATGPAELFKPSIGDIRTQGFTRAGALHYLAGGVTSVNVYVADVDEGMKVVGTPRVVSDRFINSNSAPTWSPDGQRLAYLSSRGQAGRVLVIRTMSSGEEEDINLPSDVQTGNLVPAPRWFPDGRSLLVLGFLPAGAGRYYRVDVATGKIETIHEANGLTGNGGLGAAVVSLDGKAILYTAKSSDTWNVMRFDLDTRQETVVRSDAGNALAQAPDGTQLATRFSGGTPGGCAVAVMPTGSGPRRDVVRTPGSCNPNRVSWAVNSHLVYASGGNATPNEVWHVAAGGGEPQQMGISMPGQLYNPELSPDGRHLTFAVFETGASEVWALENFLPPGIAESAPKTKR